MSNISKKISKRCIINAFKGMDTRFKHTDPMGSQKIVNFNVTSDGSIEKRCGYRKLFDFSNGIRAIWTGRINGIFCGYVLTDNRVSRFDFETKTLSAIGNISSTDTEADFFYYRGILYLVDGIEIYEIYDTYITTPFGYVPLVGKDWRDTYMGEKYQPRNLLNNQGRISYVISDDPSSFLKTDEEISTVDAVYVNGEEISSDRYSIMSVPRTVSVSGLSPGDKVMMYFTYSYSPQGYEDLYANTRAVVFGGINNSRPFLWGAKTGIMFSSAFVSDKDLRDSQRGYLHSGPLYFPEGYEFTVGDGISPITAVSRHYDRLLIFTENGAWMADTSACGIEDIPVMNINSNAGVISDGGAATLSSSPCTVGLNTIYRWRSNTNELDDCNAYSISKCIDSLLPPAFFKTAKVFADRRNGRLWFYSASLGDSVLIYSEEPSAWVIYDGIDADFFVECENGVGFIKDSILYEFDESATLDNESKEIVASFESNIMDMQSDGVKWLTAIGAKIEGGNINVEIFLNGENDLYTCVTLRSDRHRLVRKRLTSGRFQYATLRLTAKGENRQKISSLFVDAR